MLSSSNESLSLILKEKALRRLEFKYATYEELKCTTAATAQKSENGYSYYSERCCKKCWFQQIYNKKLPSIFAGFLIMLCVISKYECFVHL